jgi:hypothetical protein
MSDKNQQSSGPFYAIIIACIISFLIVIYNSFVTEKSTELDYFSGYYEADPYFLDLSNLKNMSILIKKDYESCEYSGRLMWVENENGHNKNTIDSTVEEINISIDIKKIKNISIYKKECTICIQSDVDHPLTNCDIKCIVNIKSGEIGMYDMEKSILLASFIKDNAISLYINK